MTEYYLPEGMPAPVPENDGLDAEYWQGLIDHKLLIQQCNACNGFQWGPEWICHRCLSFDLRWTEVAAEGSLYSWERPWHPVAPALKKQSPTLWSS